MTKPIWNFIPTWDVEYQFEILEYVNRLAAPDLEPPTMGEDPTETYNKLRKRFLEDKETNRNKVINLISYYRRHKERVMEQLPFCKDIREWDLFMKMQIRKLFRQILYVDKLIDKIEFSFPYYDWIEENMSLTRI